MNKILIVNNENISLRNHRINFINYFKNLGYEIVLASAEIDSNNEKIKSISKYIPLKKLNIHSKNPFKDISFFLELFILYKSEKPDFIFHFTAKPNIYGSLAAKLLKIPSIATINGLGRVFENKNITSKIVSLLYKFSLSSSKKVFFQNSDDLNLFIENRIVKKSKCELSKGSGVDTKENKDLNKDKNFPLRFIFASRLIWSKGVEQLVLAAQLVKNKYPDVKIDIFGYIANHDKESVPLEYLKEKEKLGLIKFMGSTSNIYHEIKKSDIVILPSYYREGIPKILIETLSVGRPIITTNYVGCKETVEHGKNGYLISLKNHTELADYMIKFIEMPNETYKEFCNYSFKKAVDEFDQIIVFSKYLEYLKQFTDK